MKHLEIRSVGSLQRPSIIYVPIQAFHTVKWTWPRLLVDTRFLHCEMTTCKACSSSSKVRVPDLPDMKVNKEF